MARMTRSITSRVPKTKVQMSSNHTEVAFERKKEMNVRRERKTRKAMLVSSKGVALLLNSVKEAHEQGCKDIELGEDSREY